MNALFRILVLAGSAVLIAKLFLAGEMARYMSPSMDWLTGLTGALLGLLALSELRAWAARRAAERARSGHDERRGARPVGGAALAQLVVLAPVVIGLVVSPGVLGASAASGVPAAALLITFPPESAVARRPADRAPAPETIADVQGLLEFLRRTGEAGLGQPVEVEGTVMRDGSLAPGELGLLRYAITHCVADARPFMLLVTGDDASVPTDRWVRISGTLDRHVRGGERFVTIAARSIVPVAVPTNPYLAQ